MPSPPTPAPHPHLVQIFHRADTAQKGHLTRRDLKVALTGLLGCKPSKWELNHLLSVLPSHGGGDDPHSRGGDDVRITMEEWLTLAGHKTAFRPLALASTTDTSTVRHAFRAADGGCRGYITLGDFAALVRRVAGGAVPRGVVEEAYACVAREGRVGWREFEGMMRRRV
ncbi:uncharacterized protein EV422DRAFT_570187 [Fimicolochytrium jonesii]|uniref:uncharacterized protein n=1 Tax=Fimicolochytrium jonesii TaxID=1396493 RepID=UPI0022FE5523|nr:uncharacterized protein EV422DRAFT_570187 [Fimicolochytrium jonesii]KAI8818043.1 hypothetical protein EV422DRAFT_570187 [Fimicolochytrium jonesii]